MVSWCVHFTLKHMVCVCACVLLQCISLSRAVSRSAANNPATQHTHTSSSFMRCINTIYNTYNITRALVDTILFKLPFLSRMLRATLRCTSQCTLCCSSTMHKCECVCVCLHYSVHRQFVQHMCETCVCVCLWRRRRYDDDKTRRYSVRCMLVVWQMHARNSSTFTVRARAPSGFKVACGWTLHGHAGFNTIAPEEYPASCVVTKYSTDCTFGLPVDLDLVVVVVMVEVVVEESCAVIANAHGEQARSFETTLNRRYMLKTITGYLFVCVHCKTIVGIWILIKLWAMEMLCTNESCIFK